jgi:hypothetical protein
MGRGKRKSQEYLDDIPDFYIIGNKYSAEHYTDCLNGEEENATGNPISITLM